MRFGEVTIPFAVRRSARRKTCGVVIDVRGVHIVAPVGESAERIQAALEPRLAAVVERERRLRGLRGAPHAERQFASGESLRLLGRPYILRALPGDHVHVEMRGTRIYVTAPNPQTTRVALEGWYRAQAANVFAERTPMWAARLNVQPGRIWVRAQQTRWGSCDARGNLRLNWRLVMAPVSLIDYVIAHELAHLRAPDHSPQFWTHLRAVMPDYERRRRRLSLQGAMYIL